MNFGGISDHFDGGGIVYVFDVGIPMLLLWWGYRGFSCTFFACILNAALSQFF